MAWRGERAPAGARGARWLGVGLAVGKILFARGVINLLARQAVMPLTGPWLACSLVGDHRSRWRET